MRMFHAGGQVLACLSLPVGIVFSPSFSLKTPEASTIILAITPLLLWERGQMARRCWSMILKGIHGGACVNDRRAVLPQIEIGGSMREVYHIQ
jgi:hypothetical protein